MNPQLTPRINKLEPNIVIDGGMEIWPEGTSRSVNNNTSAYGAVLFQCNNTSSGITLTNTQQTSVPSGTNLKFSNQISKSSSGSLAAGTLTSLRYIIEGCDLDPIMTNDFSVIFWVKSSVASNRSLSIRNGTATHSLIKQYEIAQADTWELKVIPLPALNSCPGTLNRSNGSGLNINFGIVCGSTFQTSNLNSWQSGSFLSGIGEDTTWLTGTNHDFSVSGVMILSGDWTGLTPSGYRFVRCGLNFQQELAMTQRYFESSYNPETPVDSINFTGCEQYITQGSQSEQRSWGFRVTKRATPSLALKDPASGVAGQIDRARNVSDNIQVFLVGEQIGSRGFGTQTASAVAKIIRFHWVADARF